MDDEFARIFLTEPSIAKLTPVAVAEALEDFAIPALRSNEWIARAVQGALFASLTLPEDDPNRQSKTDTGKELLDRAAELSAAWLALAERTPEADSAIWDYAARDGGEGIPVEYQAFEAAVTKLDWLAVFLRRVSMTCGVEKPHWSDALAKQERILRARYLAPIFEQAYGRPATLNRWPNAVSLGPWADFYSRIVRLAFGGWAASNLEGVLKEARKLDKADRVQFAAGLIPE